MIRSTCAYLMNGDQVLMLYRNKKKADVNQGYYIGIGGKIEKEESPRACIVREVQEETGLVIPAGQFHYRGKVYFDSPGYEKETIWLYTAEIHTDRIAVCQEGTPVFVRKEDIMNLHLWEGDRIFLRRMMTGVDVFCYRFSYDAQGKLIKAEEREAEYE